MEVPRIEVKVDLVWITPDADRLIARIARVSNPENQDNPEYARLIRYLIKNKHWSPFEMVSACFEITTSRAITQQITRHRSFSYQEFSQRYSAATGFEDYAPRMKGSTNRQGSVPFEDKVQEAAIQNGMALHMANSFTYYSHLLELGVAPESARFVLPLATTSRIYMTGTLRSWIHYLELRCDPHTQQEHREIALAIRQVLREQVPTVAEALAWEQS